MTCEHASASYADAPSARTPDGCEECLASGGEWVYLRLCMACGHVGCCDASPNKHATAHHAQTGHPVIRSYEPGQTWWHCYEHDTGFEVEGVPAARA